MLRAWRARGTAPWQAAICRQRSRASERGGSTRRGGRLGDFDDQRPQLPAGEHRRDGFDHHRVAAERLGLETDLPQGGQEGFDHLRLPEPQVHGFGNEERLGGHRPAAAELLEENALVGGMLIDKALSPAAASQTMYVLDN